MADPVNASIVEHVRPLEDPRMERTTQPLWRDMLGMALGPLLTGGEGCQDMALLGQSKRAWLQAFLAFPHGLPSHATLGRVLARLHPQRFPAGCLSWTQAGAQRTQGARLSLDGTTGQASFDRATAASPLPRLSAWCSDNGGLVLGHTKTERQSHESTAMPALWPWLAMQGGSVTMDAMGCQTAIARQLRDEGGDSLLTLKGQHNKADTAVKQPLHPPSEPPLDWRTAEHCFDAFEDSHGRPVRRRVWTITDLTALPALAQWPGRPSVIAVATMRMAHQHAPVTRDSRFSIATLVRCAAAFVARMRQHGDMEHTRHGSFAGTVNADRCRIRQDHAAENMVAVRHMALNLLRQEHAHRMSLRQKRLLCGLDEHDLLTGLSRAT